MRTMREVVSVVAMLCMGAALPATALGQPNVSGGPLTGRPVTEAPFSAEATTIVWQALDNGTRVERRATARYYRDRAGHVRVEQTISGVPGQEPTAERQLRIAIQPDVASGLAYVLDPLTHISAKAPRDIIGLTVGGGSTYAVPLGWARFLVFHSGDHMLGRLGLDGHAVHEESLGTRRIEGVETTGRRITTTVPAGQWNNERPMQIVEERWESPELKLVIYSRQSNPRTGDVEYRLTNIRRVAPAADLFQIPPDYTAGSFTDNEGRTTLEYADSPREQKSTRR